MKIIKFVLVIFSLPFFVFAQNQPAGLTPESPFYFFDTLGEALKELLTFNAESKARLQIVFAAERISEMKVILETKGADSASWGRAKSRLKAHVTNASAIVADQKSKGKNVSKLAKEIDDEFIISKSALIDAFQEQKRVLSAQIDERKTNLKNARREGGDALEKSLARELEQIQAKQKLLKQEQENIINELETEEEKVEKEIKDRRHEEKPNEETAEEKEEMDDEDETEHLKEKTKLLNSAFQELGGLLAQAKAAFKAGNVAELKNLAKQAQTILREAEDVIDELAEEQEKAEDVEEDKHEAPEHSEKNKIIFSLNVFAVFEQWLAQAKTMFTEGDYQGVKRLINQAQNLLDYVD